MFHLLSIALLAGEIMWGIAPHYSKGKMGRAADIHGVPWQDAQCVMASSVYPLGSEVLVTATARTRKGRSWAAVIDPATGKPWARTQRCRVVDICSPSDTNRDRWNDCKKNLRQGRILELSWTDKLEMCGTRKELPEQCLVKQQLIKRGRA